MSSRGSFAGFWVSGPPNRCCLITGWELGCKAGSVGVGRADKLLGMLSSGSASRFLLQVHRGGMVGTIVPSVFFLPVNRSSFTANKWTACRRKCLITMISFFPGLKKKKKEKRLMTSLVQNFYFYSTSKTLLCIFHRWQVCQQENVIPKLLDVYVSTFAPVCSAGQIPRGTRSCFLSRLLPRVWHYSRNRLWPAGSITL